jgi:hypothetical protein
MLDDMLDSSSTSRDERQLMKTETVAEFLARGGKIEKVETVQQSPDKNAVSGVPKTLLDLRSLGEAEELYISPKKRKINLQKINRDLLPDEIKVVYDEIIRDLSNKTESREEDYNDADND